MKTLFYPADPPYLRKWITTLRDDGFYVERLTKHQIKVLDVSFFGAKGRS
jgi:hypothetical protein